MKNLQSVIDSIRNFTHDELVKLADVVNSEARKKDPKYLAEQAQYAKWAAERQAQYAEKENHRSRVQAALIKFLKPGMKLKMIGCKDGTGVREFIRWDDDQLVCWKIIRQRDYNPATGIYTYTETKSNQVTTHMADKVSRIYIDGTALSIKSILAPSTKA